MVTKTTLQSTVLVPSSANDFSSFCNKLIVDLFILKKELEFYLEQVALFADLNETSVELDDELKPILQSVRGIIHNEIQPIQQQLTHARLAETDSSNKEEIRYKSFELLQAYRSVVKQSRQVKLQVQTRIAM